MRCTAAPAPAVLASLEQRRGPDAALPALSRAARDVVMGVVGSEEPPAATCDAHDLLGFDEVIISMPPARESQWLHLDLPPDPSPRSSRQPGRGRSRAQTPTRRVGGRTARRSRSAVGLADASRGAGASAGHGRMEAALPEADYRGLVHRLRPRAIRAGGVSSNVSTASPRALGVPPASPDFYPRSAAGAAPAGAGGVRLAVAAFALG